MRTLIFLFIIKFTVFCDKIDVDPKSMAEIIQFMMENCGRDYETNITIGVYGMDETKEELISSLKALKSSFKYVPSVSEDFRKIDEGKYIYNTVKTDSRHPYSIVFSGNISYIKHSTVLVYIEGDKIVIMINVDEASRLKLKFSNAIIGSVGFYSPDKR